MSTGTAAVMHFRHLWYMRGSSLPLAKRFPLFNKVTHLSNRSSYRARSYEKKLKTQQVLHFFVCCFTENCYLCRRNHKMAIRYTHKEELWNSWSHAGGIVMGVVFGVIFIVMAFKGDNPWARLGVCLYLFGMLGSYVASTIYHALPRRSKWKERLRKWDHAAIYWHIAGSYSPLTLVALRTQGYWGWTLFCFVWLCAIVGTTISFIRLKEHSNVETFCFVGMGLCVLVALKPLIDSVSTAAFIWIVAEGVAYITGAVFYSFNKKRYMHSVFHFFVLLGSLCHIIAVWDVLMEYI
jgi:hemolysin III